METKTTKACTEGFISSNPKNIKKTKKDMKSCLKLLLKGTGRLTTSHQRRGRGGKVLPYLVTSYPRGKKGRAYLVASPESAASEERSRVKDRLESRGRDFRASSILRNIFYEVKSVKKAYIIEKVLRLFPHCNTFREST